MFWQTLEKLQRWQRKNLPGIETKQGIDLLVWLLKNEGRPRLLKDLYRSSQCSEPTIRAVLKVFAGAGLVVIEHATKDSRRKYVRASPELYRIVAEYQALLKDLAEPPVQKSC